MKDQMTDGYFCTGVYATTDEVERMKAAYRLPVARIGGHFPDPEKVMHAAALAHGLPEIRGHYGCDFRDGEFIREKDALDMPPDKWSDGDPDGYGNTENA